MRVMGDKPTILYVDDQEENLIGFETSFLHDYNTETALNTVQAAEILMTKEIKVAIIDYKMPKEDGISFVKRIKDIYPNIIFVLMTAYADLDIAVNTMNLNLFYHFIQKPWNREEVRIVINNAIDKYNSSLERKELVGKLEQSLKEQQKLNMLKTSFLGNINHEIRTPVNAIIGFSELAGSLTSDDKLKYFLDIINKSGKQLMNIFEDVLLSSIILSQQLKLKIEEINFCRIIEVIISEMKNKYKDKENISVINLIDPDLTCFSDKDKIAKIMDSILDNAFKFTDEGEIVINSFKNTNNEFCTISIQNNSYITSESKEILFDPFRRGDESISRLHGGNGLGLFIAKSYIEFIGGEIWFESNKENGTTFNFSVGNTSDSNSNSVNIILE